MKRMSFRLSAVLFSIMLLNAAAPSVPERQDYETDADTPLYARLILKDVSSVRCVLTTKPRKGSLRLASDGEFIYTPDAGKHGRDYFGYRLENNGKELSEEATVILRINRPSA